MKKLLLSSLAVAALSLASLSVQAAPVGATANNAFDVSVALTPVCVATNGGTQTLSFAYTAFGAAVTQNSSKNLVFKCTRNVAPVSVSVVGGASGTLAGLDYTLSVGTAVQATTGLGNTLADTFTYNITGGIAAGQAGDASTATSETRQLQIAY